MDVLAKLGIDLHVVFVQVLNFGILAAILTYLLYSPVTRIIEERKKAITDSEHKADKIAKDFADAQKKMSDDLAKAHQESRVLIDEARKNAKAVEEQLLADAKAKSEKLVAEGAAQLSREREKVAAELQATVSELVTMATAKILAKEVGKKEQDAAIAEALKSLPTSK